MKIKVEQSGGSDKMNAKLVIQLVDDKGAPEEASIFPTVRTIEVSFAGYGIFKVLISGVSQTQTGRQDDRPKSVERILELCDLGEQYAEVKEAMLDFLSEHFGPITLSPSEIAMAAMQAQPQL